jgi:signal transduction histidine kinase
MRAVAVACHELRGPLASIALGLELGARVGGLAPARLDAIELELGRATLALDDLAAVPATGRVAAPFARVGTTVGQERVDVADLVGSGADAWRVAARAAGGELRLRGPGHPVLVAGERLRLAQAIGNLLANAIEHGGGVIDVSVSSARRTVRVEILDGGPGLPAPIEDLARPRRSGLRGAVPRHGHGLAVAGAVAAAHGGRLACAPSERGARMVLELPLADPVAVSALLDG